MKISVIIPTFNRRDVITRTLPTLFNQDFPENEYEVIVVIDGAIDDTAEMLQRFAPTCAFRFCEQPNQGQAVAKNAAADLARGELLLFLDDDLICDATLLREHVLAHREQPDLVVFGPVFVASESPDTLATDMLRTYTDGVIKQLITDGGSRWPDNVMIGANSSMPRSAFLGCGGFDETYLRSYEDADLGLRLWKRGIRFSYQPKAVTYTLYVKSAYEWAQDGWWYGRNEARLCRKHPEYRPYSSLARIGTGSIWKQVAREVVARSLVYHRLTSRWVCLVLESLCSIRSFRRVGIRLLGLLRRSLSFRGALCALGSWNALRSEFGVRLPVLLYHYIGPRESGDYSRWTVSPDEFARQVRWLVRRGYVGISPSDWLAWVREGKPLPAKPVLLTFDDAYADLTKYAFPILKQYGFSAGVFVVTNWIGRRILLHEADSAQRPSVMNAEQIRKWASEGIEFGAHSHSHRDLTTLGRADLIKEIRENYKMLSAILQHHVFVFAYPFGRFNDVVREVVRSQFEMAFTDEAGINSLPTDLDLLQRITVNPGNSFSDLAWRMQFGRNPIRILTAGMRIRSRIKRGTHILKQS